MIRCTLLAAATFALATAGATAGSYDWAVAILPSGAEFRLEIVTDPVAQARGYMFREEVTDDEGMLFVYPESAHQSFWMKNCKVPLDIIWLDARMRVVGIAADQPPCPEDGPCPSIEPLSAAHYALELRAGMAARHGLVAGDRIQVLSEPALR